MVVFFFRVVFWRCDVFFVEIQEGSISDSSLSVSPDVKARETLKLPYLYVLVRYEPKSLLKE